ncbi:replication protein A 70 kDa DNA-binding subunit B-like protein [Tanacetum coccineum]
MENGTTFAGASVGITFSGVVDLIGELVGILRPIQHESMTILLKDLEGSRIQCTLSNDYKHELMSLIGTDMHCPKILIIQFGTVFKIDGIVKVRNLKAATRLFLNGDVPENHAYIRSITSSTTSMRLLAKQAVYLSSERFFANTECTHQLNQVTQVCQIQSCILLATVTDISNEGWMYIACLNCNRNVHPIIKESPYHDRGYPVFECLECSANFKCVAPRYRVKVTVFDEHTKTSTILILFDHEVTQIIGKSAYSLYDLFVNN